MAKAPVACGWSTPTASPTIDALVKADPFWPTGLRKSVRILKWNQVFADGQQAQAQLIASAITDAGCIT